MPALVPIPHPDDEQTLLARAADGDPHAREAIARAWTPRVYRFAWRMLHDEQDARDVAQEVMVRVLDRLDRYDPSRPFSTWVYACARNRCIDEQRRRVRRPAAPLPADTQDPSPSPALRVAAAREADRVREAVDRLPPSYG